MTQLYDVDSHDLAAIAFSVNAQLSLNALLHAGRLAWVASERTKPLVVPVLKETLRHIHVPLQQATDAVRNIGPQSTLTDLQRAASKIEQSLRTIEDSDGEWSQSVNQLSRVTGDSLEKPLGGYYWAIHSAMDEMKLALSTNDTAQVSAARLILLGQAVETARLNREIEALMKRYDIADGEVGYTFRGK